MQIFLFVPGGILYNIKFGFLERISDRLVNLQYIAQKLFPGEIVSLKTLIKLLLLLAYATTVLV